MEGDDRKTVVFLPLVISIHSLRMEGDRSEAAMARPTTEFQSTPSAWRETQGLTLAGVLFDISIHSLRMEGDTYSCS